MTSPPNRLQTSGEKSFAWLGAIHPESHRRANRTNPLPTRRSTVAVSPSIAQRGHKFPAFLAPVSATCAFFFFSFFSGPTAVGTWIAGI